MLRFETRWESVAALVALALTLGVLVAAVSLANARAEISEQTARECAAVRTCEREWGAPAPVWCAALVAARAAR